MDVSPAQKLDQFSVEKDIDDLKAVPLVGLPELSRPATDAVQQTEHSIAATSNQDEASEPLLRENPNRFVLFPIKYHEVRASTRR